MVEPFQSHIIPRLSPTLATSRVFECTSLTAIRAVEPEMSMRRRNCSTSFWSMRVTSSWRNVFISETVKGSKRFDETDDESGEDGDEQDVAGEEVKVEMKDDRFGVVHLATFEEVVAFSSLDSALEFLVPITALIRLRMAS